MKEVIAILRPEKWQATKEAMNKLQLAEPSHFRVLGRGRQRGLRYLRRAAEGPAGVATTTEGSMQFLPKRMVTWLVADDMVNKLVAALVHVNQTGNFGDGKLFICPVESVNTQEFKTAE